MNVVVNGVTINVNNAYAEREEDITLFVLVPQTSIAYDNLKTLFKNNTEDIIKTDGNKVETFSGFTYVNTVDDDANNQYIVRLKSSELEFQRERNRILEKEIEDLKKQGYGKGISVDEIEPI